MGLSAGVRVERVCVCVRVCACVCVYVCVVWGLVSAQDVSIPRDNVQECHHVSPGVS